MIKSEMGMEKEIGIHYYHHCWLPVHVQYKRSLLLQAGILAVGRGNKVVEPLLGSDGKYLLVVGYTT